MTDWETRFNQLYFRYESWRLGRPMHIEAKSERPKFAPIRKSFGGAAPRPLTRSERRQFRKLHAILEGLGREWRLRGNQMVKARTLAKKKRRKWRKQDTFSMRPKRVRHGAQS